MAPVLLYGDVPAWLVLGHWENLEVMRSPHRFSADSRNWRAVTEGLLAENSPLRPMTAWQPLVCFAEGDKHARLRSAITESLESINSHGTRRYVTRYTNRLIDLFSAQGEADLVTDFAEKLPALVLAQRFGIPEKDALPLGHAVRDMISGSATAYESNGFVVEAMRELVTRKRKELDDKTEQPGKDLASLLLRHESALTDDEVREHLRHALVAAMNTVNLISSTLRKVLTDPRFRGSLSGGTMTLPDSLDQVLWDDPPLAVVPTRFALCDTVLAGTQIQAGDIVMLGLAAGNVDPGIRPDLTASVHGNRSHLAFGSGVHGCPGEGMSRAIAETGIDILLARLPDVELAVHDSELRPVGSWLSRSLPHLRVRFTPRRPHKEAAPTATAASGVLPPAVEPQSGNEPEPPTPQRRSWLMRLLRR
ncbi:cytochrome P450 [Streptomyces sp. NPDC005283]|uniref:cytochrome P450 n=1 Tax=Streptomyces sp. NPDC005283 TaxID=3156871 RepID=UPI003453D4AD